jgi:hypothetical protein
MKYRLISKRKGTGYEHNLEENNGDFATITKEVRVNGDRINRYIELNEESLGEDSRLTEIGTEFKFSGI